MFEAHSSLTAHASSYSFVHFILSFSGEIGGRMEYRCF